MKDIKINTLFMKIQYVISWIGFLIGGIILGWLIALGLASYGKDTDYNKENKKGVLNKTYQKFIFIYGSIMGDLFLVILIIDLVRRIFTGKPL